MANNNIRNGVCASALIIGALTAVPSMSAQEDLPQEDEVKRIQTVIVTAQKQEQALQDVPLAISAYTGDFIEDLGIRDAMELSEYSPSLEFRTGNSVRNSGIAVRGIGSGGGFNAGVDGSVGVYLNGIYIPKQAGILQTLTDIQAVELLKGPQGTLYGANTPSGVLNINTAKPSQQFEAQFDAGIGSFGLREGSGLLSGGITENIASRVAFWMREDDGWLGLAQGGHSNSRSDYGGRVRTVWDVSESLELDFIADYSKVESVCCDGEWIDISDESLATFDRMAAGLNLDRDVYFPSREGDGFMGRGESLDHVSFSQAQGREEFEHWGLSIKGIADLDGIFDGHTLTTTASYRDFNSNQSQDPDEVGVDIVLYADQPEERKTTTIEVQLSSPTDRFLEYTAGLFYLKDDAYFQQQSQLRTPGCLFSRRVEGLVLGGAIPDTAAARSLCNGWGRSDQWEQTWDSYAAFGQGTLNFTDNWSLILGARVSTDEKSVVKTVRSFDAESEEILRGLGVDVDNLDINFGNNDARVNGLGVLFGTAGFEDSVDNTEITWSATTQYFVDDIPAADSFMVYLRAATGYKSPGINARPIRFPSIPRAYDEETSKNFELGIKSTWFDNRLQTNLAVYKNNFDNLQQIASDPIADPAGAQGTFVQNAGELQNVGVELDYIAQLNDWLSINGGVAYLDSEFVEFFGAPCPNLGSVPADPINGALCDYTGLSGAFAPEWRATNTARLDLPLNEAIDWNASLTWVYMDDHYVNGDRDDRALQEGYSLFNASIGLNGTDGLWSVSAWGRNLSDEQYLNTIGNASVAGYAGFRGSKVGYFGMPRSFGVRGSRKF